MIIFIWTTIGLTVASAVFNDPPEGVSRFGKTFVYLLIIVTWPIWLGRLIGKHL